MNDRIPLWIAQSLAVTGLVFWTIYVLKYILGAPLFLNAAEDHKLAFQIGFGIYGYITLLIGVFLGALYQELKSNQAAGNTHINIAEVIKQATRSADFWLGISASPVVYAILLQALNMEDISLTAGLGLTLVGLQNGFVCNTIADSMINNRPSPPRPDQPQP